MARKSVKITTFSDRIEEYAKEALTEAQQVKIAKTKYLIEKEADIIQVNAEGYTYALIAEVATMELLESGVPKFFIVKNKEGKEVEHEVKIRALDIKNICEPEENK